jgi:hypothetical protein
MANISQRYRGTRAATNYLAELVGAHLRYPAAVAPANDSRKPSACASQRAPLTPGEINERLLALLCMCVAGAIGALWFVSNLTS